MNLRNLLILVLMSVLSAYGCSSGSFKGGAEKTAQDQKVGAKGAQDGADGGDDTNKGTGPDDESLNDADEQDDEAGGDEDESEENEESGGNDGGRSIFDTIADIIEGITNDDEDEFEQPDDNTVIFGANKVFHIGDDGFQNTSCRFEIDSYRLKGTQYYFEFEVLEDETRLDINLNKVCGIDYENISSARLLYGSYEVKKEIFSTSTFNLELISGQEFDKGKYVIVVESGRGDPRNPDDYDNFVVGELKIKSLDADKPIKAGRVGARTP